LIFLLAKNIDKARFASKNKVAKPSTNFATFNGQLLVAIGKCFDVEGAYGNQCRNGAALLWQQLGRTLATRVTAPPRAAADTYKIGHAATVHGGGGQDVRKVK
jgi:hypothetical protein